MVTEWFAHPFGATVALAGLTVVQGDVTVERITQAIQTHGSSSSLALTPLARLAGIFC